MSADNWQCPRCANVVSTLSAVCDNCGYDRRTMPDPTRREPETSPERAELQVSLGAPIEVPVNVNQAQVLMVRMFESLQRDVEQLRKWLDPTSDTTGVHSEFNYLTSMCAKTSDKVSDLADTLGIHKLSLEGIQGLLVERNDKVPGPLEWDWATAAYIVNGKRITPELIEMVAEFGLSSEAMQQQMAIKFEALEARLDHDSIAGLWERLDLILGVLGKRDSQVGRKPRKAGKRNGKRK